MDHGKTDDGGMEVAIADESAVGLTAADLGMKWGRSCWYPTKGASQSLNLGCVELAEFAAGRCFQGNRKPAEVSKDQIAKTRRAPNDRWGEEGDFLRPVDSRSHTCGNRPQTNG